MVDLRSDTLTMPTKEMREAMYQAEVGDDQYGEDPTMAELENLGAAMLGKEAGLFVASGTMGNQVAAMAHTTRGDEIICEADSHILLFEAAGLAYLAGVQARQAPSDRGALDLSAVESMIRPGSAVDVHYPDTTLICVENTHNRAGGTCYPLDKLAALKALAEQHRIAIHMDGARIFNAAVAQKVSAKEIARQVDSVQFCLSKGLCAPVGSLLVGTKAFIQRARKYRQLLGGALRQSGVLAAAGLVALSKMVDRLAEDHVHARLLGEALANLGYGIDLVTVQTNIVIFDVAPLKTNAVEFCSKLMGYGIKAAPFGETVIRIVPHHGISRAEIDYTIDVLTKLKPGCC